MSGSGVAGRLRTEAEHSSSSTAVIPVAYSRSAATERICATTTVTPSECGESSTAVALRAVSEQRPTYLVEAVLGEVVGEHAGPPPPAPRSPGPARSPPGRPAKHRVHPSGQHPGIAYCVVDVAQRAGIQQHVVALLPAQRRDARQLAGGVRGVGQCLQRPLQGAAALQRGPGDARVGPAQCSCRLVEQPGRARPAPHPPRGRAGGRGSRGSARSPAGPPPRRPARRRTA